MKNFQILFLIVVLCSFSSKAFMNIESVRQLPGDGFVGKSGLQVTGQEGNTNKVQGKVSTLGVFRFPDDEYLFTGSYETGSSQRIRDTNRGNAHLRYTLHHREARAYEFFAQSEFDEFRDLNSRNLAGANLRFRILSSEVHKVFLGAGSFYEIENLKGADDEEGFRGNFYTSYIGRINEVVSSAVTLYYQPFLRDPEEFRVRFQSGLDVKLSTNLSIDLDFNLTHDNGLPPEVVQTDVDYLVGFSISY